MVLFNETMEQLTCKYGDIMSWFFGKWENFEYNQTVPHDENQIHISDFSMSHFVKLTGSLIDFGITGMCSNKLWLHEFIQSFAQFLPENNNFPILLTGVPITVVVFSIIGYKLVQTYRQVRDWRRHVNFWNASYWKLTNFYELLAEDIRDFKFAVYSQEAGNESLCRKLETCIDHNSILKINLDEMKSTAREVTAQAKQITMERDTAQKDLIEAKKKLSMAESRLNKLCMSAYPTVKRECENAKNKLIAVEYSNKNIEMKLNQLENSLGAQLAIKLQFENELEKVLSEISFLRTELSSANSVVSFLEEKLISQGEEMEYSKDELKCFKDFQLQDPIVIDESEFKSSQQRQNSLQASIDYWTQENNKLKSRVSKIITENSNENIKHSKFTILSEYFDKRLSEPNAELKTLDLRLESLRNEKEALSEVREKKDTIIFKYEKKLKNLKDKFMKSRDFYQENIKSREENNTRAQLQFYELNKKLSKSQDNEVLFRGIVCDHLQTLQVQSRSRSRMSMITFGQIETELSPNCASLPSPNPYGEFFTISENSDWNWNYLVPPSKQWPIHKTEDLVSESDKKTDEFHNFVQKSKSCSNLNTKINKQLAYNSTYEIKIENFPICKVESDYHSSSTGSNVKREPFEFLVDIENEEMSNVDSDWITIKSEGEELEVASDFDSGTESRRSSNTSKPGSDDQDTKSGIEKCNSDRKSSSQKSYSNSDTESNSLFTTEAVIKIELTRPSLDSPGRNVKHGYAETNFWIENE